MDTSRIKEIKKQYKYTHDMVLSDTQAAKVIDYEYWLNSDAGDCHLSGWEEDDFEFAFFEQLLKPDQLAKYKIMLSARVKQRIKDLREADDTAAAEAGQNQKYADVFTNKIFPQLESYQPRLLQSVSDAVSKLQFIKAEYKLYRDRQYMRTIITHFRLNRLYQPNVLKRWLATENSLRLFPQYDHFRRVMDQTTIQVAIHVESKLDKVLPDLKMKIKATYQELDDFHKRRFETAVAKMDNVLVLPIPPPPPDVYRMMQILLIDPDLYGYDKLKLF